MQYAELLCCSNFTFLRGASHPFELVIQARALGYAALALVDECSVAGIVRAHEVATEVGLQLIIGSQFRFDEGDRVILLVPTPTAYAQLCELVTKARRSAKKGSYSVTREDFSAEIGDCIGLWMSGPKLDPTQASWFSTLPLAYHALAFTHILAQGSRRQLEALRNLSLSLSIPMVAVGDVHYHVRSRRRLHDVITAIRGKTTVEKIGRRGFANGERHLRPLATLEKLYPPDLLHETIAIARRCVFSLNELHYEYPEELVPLGRTPIDHLRALTEGGLGRRWPDGTPTDVRELIEKELALIQELRYEHFFLTVEELVSFARSRGILCQGRGSAANSAVCYALGITEVDPSRVAVLFERFISRERAEPPDIDVDFEHIRREEVIQHVYGKYGRHRAAIAATVITYRDRLAVRDIGKALGLPLDVVDTLAKSLYWFDGSQEIPEQLVTLGFDRSSRIAQDLIRLVSEIKGFPRHLSQHVGGFVISQHALSSLVPVENASMPDRTIIQWDKNDLETLGLLKVDCLALGMLTAVSKALDMISKFSGAEFRVQDIPSEDPDTYDMICEAQTVGVFQIESQAQMSMLPRLRPREYFDLVIEVAIIRPGPIQGDMVNPYLRRRQGLDPVTYPSRDIERVLKSTLGVPLFQEQVMQLCMVAAGFDAGEADKVRRSMAAWQRRGGLEQFRERLRDGMLARGYEAGFAEQIYQQILGFGSYGFPMSHAASFALIAYNTAWLRRHRPAALVAGLLNSWPMGFYKPAQLVYDAKRNGVKFRRLDVLTSDWECTLEPGRDGDPQVRLGFRLVSGLSQCQCQQLVAERQKNPFVTVDDLAHRAQLDRRTLQLLARAGALKSLAKRRRAAHWAALGVEHLPHMLAGHSAKEASIELRPGTAWGDTIADYRSTGLSLGLHPLSYLRAKLDRLGVCLSAHLRRLDTDHRVRVAGLVTHRQRPETASGVIFLSIEDEAGLARVIVWPSVQEAQRRPVLSARLVVVDGKVQNEKGVIHVIADRVRDYTEWLADLSTESRDFR